MTNLRLLKSTLDFANDPLKSFGRQLVFFGHPSGTERGAKKDVEKEGCVFLGLERERISSFDNHQLTAQLLHILETDIAERQKKGEEMREWGQLCNLQ